MVSAGSTCNREIGYLEQSHIFAALSTIWHALLFMMFMWRSSHQWLEYQGKAIGTTSPNRSRHQHTVNCLFICQDQNVLLIYRALSWRFPISNFRERFWDWLVAVVASAARPISSEVAGDRPWPASDIPRSGGSSCRGDWHEGGVVDLNGGRKFLAKIAVVFLIGLWYS